MLNRFVRHKTAKGPDDFAAILFVAVGAAVVGVTLVVSRPWPTWGPEAFDVTIVVGTTILLAGLIQFLTQLIRRISESGVRHDFHSFFGTTDFAFGVIPNLVTKHDLEGWRPDDAAEAHPKGITTVVPFEDLKAATKVAQLFDRFGVRFRLRPDDPHMPKIPKNTFVAIGLGFNSHTHRLARYSDLFQIIFENKTLGEAKDDFLLLNKDYRGRMATNGREGTECALVARVPVKQRGGDVTGFVCAGRLAAGTVAASVFLRDDWRWMYEAYCTKTYSLDEYALGVVIEYDGSSLRNIRPIAAEFKRLVHEPAVPEPA